MFGFFLLAELFFSEMFADIAKGKDSPTFFGWCLVSLVTALIWLMVWRMLREIRSVTSISILLASVIAVCVGFMMAMDYGYNRPFEAFGVSAIIVPMALAGCCLLALVIIRIWKRADFDFENK
jgi:glycerol-3-phosphate acyltransferase PlsY